MQPREPAPHRVQLFLAKRILDAWKQFVLFKPHMIVKKFSKAAHLFGFNRGRRRKTLLEIQHGRANLRVIGKDSHDFRIPVKPRVPRERGEQYFLLFAKVRLPRLMPEADEFLRLARNGRCAFLRGRFRRAPHLQRLNQRKVVVLAKRVQTRMAFQCWAGSFVKPMAGKMATKWSLTRGLISIWWQKCA
jgi:hypothetical protein